MKIDPNKLTQGPGYAGEKLSLNFQNIEVRALLQVIADFTNFNVVTSDTVTGNVTLRLKDVPWDQALDIILQAKGLGMRKNGNVLWIAPKDELAAKEKVDLESQEADRRAGAAAHAVVPAQLRQGRGRGHEPDRPARPAGGSGGRRARRNRILSPRGSVIFESRTNQLFVTDIPSKLEEVQALIAKIDIPVRQVLIEARIVEADDTFGRSLGVKLGAADLRGLRGGIPGYSVGGGNYVTVGGNYNAVGAQTVQVDATGDFSRHAVRQPAGRRRRSAAATAATFALSLFSAAANRFLNLELSALEADGKGKVVSSPRVITADQVKALIEQGTETAVPGGHLQRRDVDPVPQGQPEARSHAADHARRQRHPGRRRQQGQRRPAPPRPGFAINTKHVKTQVLVENGGTVVIGGIFTQTERDDVNKVPLLGDIPVLGNLFKNTHAHVEQDRTAGLHHAQGRDRPLGGALRGRLGRCR